MRGNGLWTPEQQTQPNDTEDRRSRTPDLNTHDRGQTKRATITTTTTTTTRTGARRRLPRIHTTATATATNETGYVTQTSEEHLSRDQSQAIVGQTGRIAGAEGDHSISNPPQQAAVDGGLCAASAAPTGAASEEGVSDKEMQEYRNHCIVAGQKSQEDYDKSLLALAGGALGVSFAFLKDVVGPGPLANTFLLLASWLLWAVCIICTLASFWCSQQALRKAVMQIDAKAIRHGTPGGAFAHITSWLNAIGGLAFVAGVVAMVVFVVANVRAIRPSEPIPAKPSSSQSPPSTSGIGNAQTK